jgi:hypothetical protein
VVITHENTRYSAQVRTPAGHYRRGVNRKDYWDKVSKVTGQPCLHIELKHVGAQTIQRALGVTEAREFPHVDPVELFRNGLVLVDVDLEVLGREYENRRLRQRRRQVNVSTYGYNQDRAVGSCIYRYFACDSQRESRSMQSFVSRYGHSRAVQALDLSPLFTSTAVKQNGKIRWQNNHMVSTGYSTSFFGAHNHRTMTTTTTDFEVAGYD